MWREKKIPESFFLSQGLLGSQMIRQPRLSHVRPTQETALDLKPRRDISNQTYLAYPLVESRGYMFNGGPGIGLHLRDICVRSQQAGVPNIFPGMYLHSFSEANNFLPCLAKD